MTQHGSWCTSCTRQWRVWRHYKPRKPSGHGKGLWQATCRALPPQARCFSTLTGGLFLSQAVMYNTPLSTTRNVSGLKVPGSKDAAEAEAFLQQCVWLLMRLLVKYLRYASPSNAEACASNAVHLLPGLIDVTSPVSRCGFRPALEFLRCVFPASALSWQEKGALLLCT